LNSNFGKFDQVTKEDRERALEQYQRRQERQYLIGKIIVYTIATIHIISTLISAIIDFSLFSFVIQLALGIALFAGVTWVRYLFVLGAGLSIFIGLALVSEGYLSEVSPGFIGLFAVQMIYPIIASVLLLAHSGVKEFLYSQKNG
jgi:hypothetical protein